MIVRQRNNGYGSLFQSSRRAWVAEYRLRSRIPGRALVVPASDDHLPHAAARK
jgi:hypothetical protein